MPDNQRSAIYLDNAATSWPKPDCVASAVRNHVLNYSANPGRAAHRMAANASRVVFDTREALGRLLGVSDSRNIILNANATMGLNLVIHGLLKPGDHVVTTSMEHNSVMRPLRWQTEHGGVSVTMVKSDRLGRTTPEQVKAAVTDRTKLVIVNNASNVIGTIAPIAGIKSAIGEIPLLVDAAQTAGVLSINVEEDAIDMLACTGHKGLLGPQGTGCIYISPSVSERIKPLMQGGTGSNSESDEIPSGMPDRFESGTLNGTGIAGLGAAVSYILDRGVDAIREHELALADRLLAGLGGIPGLTEYGPEDPRERTGTFSVNIEGLTPSEIGFELDRKYNIAVRIGLHCAPEAHRSIGTFPQGTVRIGLSALTSMDEVDAVVIALGEIAGRKTSG